MSGFQIDGISNDKLDKIHQASIHILRKPGIKIESEEAAEIFHGAGAEIDKKDDGFIVKIPSSVVDDCVQWAPERFVLYGRDPMHDHTVEPGSSCFTLFGENSYANDLYTLNHRTCTKKDLGDATRLADALDEFAIIEKCMGSRDKHPDTQSLHNYEAMVSNTGKHAFHGFFSGKNAKKIITMAAACVGGMEKFSKRPCVSTTVCPTSPLILSKNCCDVIIECAKSGVAICSITMPMSGATAPATMAGTLVVQNAELLGSLVLTQLVSKKSPFIYGSVGTIMDLKNGNPAVAAPECGVLNVGTAKMAHYYGIPSWCGSGVSGSKRMDVQAAYEFNTNTAIALLAGSNIIYGCGSIESGLTFDFAKLILDAEQLRNIEWLKRGMDISEETMCLETIQNVGPGGEYLSSSHTLKHMRSMSQRDLFDSMDRDTWANKIGGKDVVERAYEKARFVIENHKPMALPEGAKEKMEEIIKESEIPEG
jgi:trimethylamine--corrinoid protein Co-methyltransferase